MYVRTLKIAKWIFFFAFMATAAWAAFLHHNDGFTYFLVAAIPWALYVGTRLLLDRAGT